MYEAEIDLFRLIYHVFWWLKLVWRVKNLNKNLKYLGSA
jgi:hypothetical protein